MTHNDLPANSGRRSFLAASVLAGGVLVDRRFPTPLLSGLLLQQRLDARFREIILQYGQPGYAAGLVREGRLVWSGGFGFADIEAGTPMTARSVQNVGSVSKPVTTTAVLQLVEQGRLDLDEDVNRYLAFSVRNPRFPDTPITTRQLLVHRSSIADGPALGDSYVCGDHPGPLQAWLASYFTAPNLLENFHVWAPGELHPPTPPRPYSNVGYGLLGHLVERVAKVEFAEYCRRNVLDRLGMHHSSFRLRDIPRHNVPYYNRVSDEFTLAKNGKAWEWDAKIAKYPFNEHPPIPGQLFPYCNYSFGTPPDGGLRTNVEDLSHFLLSWMEPSTRSSKVLRPTTRAMALSSTNYGKMLCWDHMRTYYQSDESIPGEPWIYHDGSDPGISALLAFRPAQRSGMILVLNSSGKTLELLDAGIRALMAELP